LRMLRGRLGGGRFTGKGERGRFEFVGFP
jgi:hypothetical protein